MEVLYLLNMPGFNVQLRKNGWSYDIYQSVFSDSLPFAFCHSPFATDKPFDIQTNSEQRTTNSIRFHRIDFKFIGSRPDYEIIASVPSTDHLNYHTAGMPAEGITNVRRHQRITYKNVYPFIDIEFLLDENAAWKYNVIIHPGGKVEDIRIQVSEPELFSFYDDSLNIHTTAGNVNESIPESYYEVGDEKRTVDVWFRRISKDIYGFSVSQPFPEESTLCIDPTCIRLWGTYYGGGDFDAGQVVVTDTNHHVILIGVTQSVGNIATAGAYQTIYFASWWVGFIAKFNTHGERQWGTYYQGSVNGIEEIWSGVTDISGNILIAGITSSDTGIATPGAHQTIYGGENYDGFLAKFTPDGQRVWATYYGGEAGDDISGVTIDHNGNIFCSGFTNSYFNIATPGSFQPTHYPTSANEAFLVKFDSNGIRQWGTYYGGEAGDGFTTCCVDTAGNLFVTGYTSSQENIASPGAYQMVLAGGNDAVLIAFDSDGQRLWGTYYGGTQMDEGKGCTTDSTGYIYIVGRTNSGTGIASPGSHQPIPGGGDDGFIVKFNTDGQRIWGSYYGGNNYEQTNSCSVGENGDIFITGFTSSANNISSPNAFMPTFKGVFDAYLVKFNANGQRQWGTYFGDGASDQGNSCWYLDEDTVYLGGRTYSSANIATLNGHQPTFGGASDAFLIKFLECWPIEPAGPINGPDAVCPGTDSVVYSIQPLAHAVTYAWTLPPGATSSGGNNTASVTVSFGTGAVSGNIWVTGLNKCGDPGDSAFLFVTVHTPPVPSISGNDTACRLASEIYITQSGMNNYIWGISPGGTITAGGTPTSDSVEVTWNGLGNQWIEVNYTDTNGCSALNPSQKTVWVEEEGPTLTNNPLIKTICSGESTYLILTSSPPATTYQWTAAGSGPLITGYSNGTGDTIDQVLENPDTVSGTVTYTITPIGEGCPGIPADFLVTVNPMLPVSVWISASANPVCAGIPVSFTATPTNGGSSPVYQWQVNAVNAGMNNAVFTYTPVNGDVVTCSLTSSELCTSGNPATSNSITMSVQPLLPVSIAISPSVNPVCAGDSITFTATPTNGGSFPVYQWQVNAINTGMNNAVFTYIPTDGDSVRCILISSELCTANNPASSIPYPVSVIPSPIVTFTPCFDTITTTNAKPIRLKGGIPLGGTYSGSGVSNGWFYPGIAGQGTHEITYSYTNTAGCERSSSFSILNSQFSIHQCGTPSLDIRDSTLYPTVQIGSQCWFATNLTYGTEIPYTIPQRDNCIPEKYTRLTSYVPRPTFYQWDELMGYEEAGETQGLCPPGWHVPTEAEWNLLFSNWTNNAFAGAPLKYTGYSGFNALLFGTGFFNRGWYLENFVTFFWSSTSHGPSKAWSHAMNEVDFSVSYYPSYRANAFAVRCIRD